jgi:hypothetical protein
VQLLQGGCGKVKHEAALQAHRQDNVIRQ